MTERRLSEQLDLAVQAVLDLRPAEPSEPEPQIAALAAIAADLRQLPRVDFRARLQSELERSAIMSANEEAAAAPVREGYTTVTPYLVVGRLDPFVDFLKQAFGAEEILRAPGSAGGTHVELRLGDSMIMAGGASGYPGTPSALHLYVRDADTVYQRAIAAGAEPIYEMMDMPYGDREGGVRDGFGNSWTIATHRATGHRPEGMRTVTPTLHPRGADPLLDFMKRGLGAVETMCERDPEGTVRHAALRIGDAAVEVGEARGPIEPTAATLLLYVSDVDAAYRRALDAGAGSIEAPADQPYGERRAGVQDGHGNKWYFSGPIRKP